MRPRRAGAHARRRAQVAVHTPRTRRRAGGCRRGARGGARERGRAGAHPRAAGVAGRLDWVAAEGEYTVVEPIADARRERGRLAHAWPVRRAAPAAAARRRRRFRCGTGQRVLDLLFPWPAAATAAVPGGFGTGKTVLLQQIAKWCDADVIVYVGCGERGNEIADVLDELRALEDPRTGRPLLERTVLIANTSNMPVMAREASIYTGVTVAEYYRDMGYDVVVIADSTSRWAEALREFASRTGELPAEEGYPASLALRARGLLRARRARHRRSAATRLGDDPRRRVAPRRRSHRAGHRAHARVRPRGVVARPRPRLRPPLPGGELDATPSPATRRRRALARRARATRAGAQQRGARCGAARRGRARSSRSPSSSGPPRFRIASGRAAHRRASCERRCSSRTRSAPTTRLRATPSRQPCWRWCSTSTTGRWSSLPRRSPRARIEELDLVRRGRGAPATACGPTTPPASSAIRDALLARLRGAAHERPPDRVHARRAASAGRCWSSRTSQGSAGTSSARSAWPRARSATASCSTSTRDLAVVQVFEGTAGHRLRGAAGRLRRHAAARSRSARTGSDASATAGATRSTAARRSSGSDAARGQRRADQPAARRRRSDPSSPASRRSTG